MKPILIVGEAQGENEARINSCFVGASGIELLRMLNEASIIELTKSDFEFIRRFYDQGDPSMIDMVWNMHASEVVKTNVFMHHPPGNKLEYFCGPKATGIRGYPALLKSKYVQAEWVPELERLGDEILDVDPHLILALGNTALWALAGTTGITKLRGTTRLSTHTVAGYKLLCTIHPASVLRQWDQRPIVVADLIKAKRESDYPEIRRPAREIWIEPTLADLEDFYDRYIVPLCVHGHSVLSTDIETAGNRITCIGFAPSPSVALVVPFDDERRKNRSYWNTLEDEIAAWRFVRRVLVDRRIKKLFQNGVYDITFLWRSMKIPTYGAEEDTMLLHHALQPESLKSLGFLGSLYSDEGAWKHMRKKVTTIKRDE